MIALSDRTPNNNLYINQLPNLRTNDPLRHSIKLNAIPNKAANTKYLVFFITGYTLLIIYGTLFPLTGWNWDQGGLDILLSLNWPEKFSKTDVVINLIIYIPFGFLLSTAGNNSNHSLVIIIATLVGATLCTGLEYFQTFLPNRVASLVDIALNTAGTMFGASFALVIGKDTSFAKKLLQYKKDSFVEQPLTNLALITVVFWALSQLTPLVPSPDITNLRDGLKPIWRVIQDPSAFKPDQLLLYALNITALGLLITLFNRPGRPIIGKAFMIFLVVLLLKIPIIERQLSMEALLGVVVATAMFTILSSFGSRTKAAIAMSLLVFAYSYAGLTTHNDDMVLLSPMNWIPFKPQMGNIFGLVDLTLSIWPFIALACLLLVIKPKAGNVIGFLSTTAIFCMTFYIERQQLSLPGRYSDITDVLTAVIAFSVSFWRFRAFHYKQPDYDYMPVGKMVE